MAKREKKSPKVHVAFLNPDEFTLRFGRARRTKSVLFGATLRALRKLKGTKPRVGGAARPYTMRGARGTVRGGRDSRQRVLVKTYYSRMKSPKAGIRSLRKAVLYLRREGTGIDGREAPLLGPGDGAKVEGLYPNEQHYFRVIVSPEKGAELDMERFVTEFISGLENDLRTKLIWNGAIHYNTDSPHAHLLIRGVTDKGDSLVIDKSYIKHGMRELGRDIATRFLGLRTEHDLTLERNRELTANRLTSFDRHLFLAARNSPTKSVVIEPVASLKRGFERTARIGKLTRLQHLQALGLAQEVSPGEWRLEERGEETLRQLGIRNDALKLIQERIKGAHFGHDLLTRDSPELHRANILGEVVTKGLSDGASERTFLILSAANGVAYHVALDRFSEVQGFESKPGALVVVSVPERAKADRAIEDFSKRNEGVLNEHHLRDALSRGDSLTAPFGVSNDDYLSGIRTRLMTLQSFGIVERVSPTEWRVDPEIGTRAMELDGRYNSGTLRLQVKTISPLSIDEQVKAHGPTWLDGQLQAGARGEGGELLYGPLKERVAAALPEREKILRERGHEVSSSLVSELRKTALGRAREELKQEFGKVGELEIGRKIEGRLERYQLLGDTHFAVIRGREEVYFVPAPPRSRRIDEGQEVTLIGRERDGKYGRYLTASLEPSRQREPELELGGGR